MKIIIILLALVMIPIVYGANAFWVDTPNKCPSVNATEFSGQDCTPEDICGETGDDVAQCFDMSGVSAPTGNVTGTTNQASAFDGGYIINCFESADAAAPFCDNGGNFRCDRENACNTINVQTVCLGTDSGGGFTTSVCSPTCKSGFQQCDGSTTDADGCEIETGVTQFNQTSGSLEDNTNHAASCAAQCDSGFLDCDADIGTGGTGCEVQDGASCTVGSLSGTIDGCSGSAANCVVDPQIHYTNQSADGSSTHANLWTVQFGLGDIFNGTAVGVVNATWIINRSGCVLWNDGTSTCSHPSGGGSDFTNVAYLNNTQVFTEHQTFEGGLNSTHLNVTGNVTISGQYLGPNGSVNRPTYSFFQNDTSGMFYTTIGAGSLRFATHGTDVLAILTTGIAVLPLGTSTLTAISLGADINTGFWQDAGDELNAGAGGVEFWHLIEAAQDEMRFNDDGGDIDFTFESSGVTDSLFVEGSTGFVGIGTLIPNTPLTVDGVVNATNFTANTLISCDTIDTDAGGNFICGTDGGGGAAPSWENINDHVSNLTTIAVNTTSVIIESNLTITDDYLKIFNNGSHIVFG